MDGPGDLDEPDDGELDDGPDGFEAEGFEPDSAEAYSGEPGAPAEQEDGGDEAPDRPERDVADLEQESEIAADYVEGLLDVADLDGDIDMDVEGDRALVSVVGATLQELVGPRGEVLEALAGTDPARGAPADRQPEPDHARRRRLPARGGGRS